MEKEISDKNKFQSEEYYFVSGKEKKTFLPFVSKIKGCFFNHSDYIVPAVILAGLYLVFLIINGILFSDKTILVGDSYLQVRAFFNHFYNFFDGTSPLFYSNYYGNGMEIFSTLEYMFINPFYLIVFLGGRANIHKMFSIILFLMLEFILMTAIYFIKKYFKNISPKLRFIFALLYVFSAYVNFSYNFITWLIYPAIILIVVDRFLEFVKSGKIMSLTIAIIWNVISCFSIGIMSTVVLYILFSIYIMIVCEKEKRTMLVSRLFVSMAVAALISIIILFPSIMAVLVTDRTGSFLNNLLTTKTDYSLAKLGAIFFDKSVLIFSLAYLILCDKKDKLNIFLISASVILFMSIMVDIILKILCFSSYSGFFARLYFLNEVVIFSTALMLFDKKIVKSIDCKTEMLQKIVISFLVVIITIIFSLVSVILMKKLGNYVKSPVNSSGITFYINIALTIFLTIIFLYTLFYNKKAKISKVNYNAIVEFMLIFSLLFNFLCFTGSASSDYKDGKFIDFINKYEINGNMKNMKENDDYFNYYVNSNIRQSSTFTSLIPDKIVKSYSAMGYYTNSVCFYNSCGTLISDSLAGYNYYITDTETNRPYLELVGSDEIFYLYKNTLAGTGAFVLPRDFNFEDGVDAKQNFEKLKNYFGIEGNVFEEIEIKDEELSDKELEVTKKKGRKLSFTAPVDGILYYNGLYFDYDGTEELSHKLINLRVISKKAYKDVDFVKAGEEYTFYVTGKDGLSLDDIEFKFMNYSVAEQICREIANRSVKYEYLSDGYRVYANEDEEKRLFVMSPDIFGYTYTKNGDDGQGNGENIVANNTLSGMVYFDIDEGENIITASYRYPYKKMWLYVGIIFSILVIAILLIYKFTKLRHLEKILFYTSILLVSVLIIAIYFGGIALSIYKIFI